MQGYGPSLAPIHVAIDARPLILRSSDNIWSRAEQERDRLYQLCEQVLNKAGMVGRLLKSGPFAFPPWVNLELWVPVDGIQATERTSVTITIDLKPYHRYEFEYLIAYKKKNQQKRRTRVLPFQINDVQHLLDYLLGRRERLKLARFRELGWQLWRPKNKVDILKIDYFEAVPIVFLVLGVMSLVVSINVPARAGLMLWGILHGIVCIVIGLLGLWHARKRKLVICADSKPFGEPRQLIRVDSWQTVLFGIGDYADEFRRRFFDFMKDFPTEKFKHSLEKVWYWGLDGKEEREQIVLTHNRGVVFAQIYRYGKDLYVGWDGHLNSGQWVEWTVETGIDRGTGLLTELRYVQPGTQQVTEYDVIDLSSLMEWTHAQLVKLCKQCIQELQIDQEIDFKPLRGGRQGLVGQGEQNNERKSQFRFLRTG